MNRRLLTLEKLTYLVVLAILTTLALTACGPQDVTVKLKESDVRTNKTCFFFSDFVLQDPGDKPNEENYEIIGRMIEQGIQVVACISPLANGKIFSTYTRNSLEKIKEAGALRIETGKPAIFLEEVGKKLRSF